MQYSQSFTFVHFHSSFFAKSQISSIRSFSFIFIIHKKREINYFSQRPIVSRGNKIMISLLSHINFSEK